MTVEQLIKALLAHPMHNRVHVAGVDPATDRIEWDGELQDTSKTLGTTYLTFNQTGLNAHISEYVEEQTP